MNLRTIIRIFYSRSANERAEEDIAGGLRGTTPQQPQVETPCGACGGNIVARQRSASAGWLAHTKCVVESVQGAADRRDDLCGVAIREEIGPPRRTTFLLTQTLPRVVQRCGGTMEWCVRRRGRLARHWRSAILEAEGAANEGEKDPRVEGRAGEEAETSCTYYGRAWNDPLGVS